jgi:hypothetical protein
MRSKFNVAALPDGQPAALSVRPIIPSWRSTAYWHHYAPATSGGEVSEASIAESLGDETAAFSGTNHNLVSTFAVVWRDDNLLGFCAACGLVATDPDEAVQIAQAQQDRYAEALR